MTDTPAPTVDAPAPPVPAVAVPAVPVPAVDAGLRSRVVDVHPIGVDRYGVPTGPDLAEQYHLASRIDPLLPARALGPLSDLVLDQGPLVLGRKALSVAGPRIALPAPAAVSVDLREVVHRRRSRLPDRAAPLSRRRLGTLLGLAAGASRDPEVPHLRVVPSAGALYPVDIVVLVHRAGSRPGSLGTGAYLYDPLGHALLARPLDAAAVHAAVGAGYPPPLPSVTLALVATFGRSRAKYGLRGYRFTLLEAGHLAQSLVHVATALGLAALPLGGFADTTVDRALDLDGLDRSCVYLVAVSAPALPSSRSRA